MVRSGSLLLAAIFFLSLLISPPARGQDEQDFAQDQPSEVVSHARIVRLSYLDGTVQIDHERGFENATVNMPIAEGDRLLARSDAWAEVQFEDGSTVRLSPDTLITFAQLGLNADGGTVTAIDLDQGEALFTVKKHGNSEFAVSARNKTILLKHSGSFRVTTTNSTPLQVVVWKGEVTVRDTTTGSHVAVKKNENFRLDPFDFDKYALEKDATADDMDSWSSQRDESLRTYAAAGGSIPQSPYQYGLSDLNYYGTYYDVPGYGYLWQPWGVNPGWDPFMNGYWAWSPVCGYCWVSAYPWGWMPYRYGSWLFVGGYGWMWQPGYWQGWRPSPRLWNTPPGFRPPAPPVGSRVITGQPGIPPTGSRPGPVQPGGVKPGTVQPRPGTAAAPPAPSGGGLKVPRVDVQPDQRGHRVFTSEQIQDRVLRTDTAPPPTGAVKMERRAAPAQPPKSGAPPAPMAPPAGSRPKDARPGEVPHRPGEGVNVPAMPAPAQVPRQQAPSAPKQAAPPASPAAVQPAPSMPPGGAPQPAAPAVHDRPAPAAAPKQPAPQVPQHAAPSAPPQPPPAAPRTVAPPPAAPAPRSVSPPAVHPPTPPPAQPKAEMERGSRPAPARAPDKPR